MDQEIIDSEMYLKGLPVKGGFQVPASYFEELQESVLIQLDAEEIVYPNKGVGSGFEVPDAYFEKLNEEILAKVSNKKARIIPLFNRQNFYRFTGVAAAAIVVISLLFFQPQSKLSNKGNEAVSAEEVADNLSISDLNEDMLCDAGWCSELEKINGKEDKETNEILNETDVELIIEEL